MGAQHAMRERERVRVCVCSQTAFSPSLLSPSLSHSLLLFAGFACPIAGSLLTGTEQLRLGWVFLFSRLFCALGFSLKNALPIGKTVSGNVAAAKKKSLVGGRRRRGVVQLERAFPLWWSLYVSMETGEFEVSG